MFSMRTPSQHYGRPTTREGHRQEPSGRDVVSPPRTESREGQVMTTREKLESLLTAYDLSGREYPTNVEIADILSVSRERIRQILREMGRNDINRKKTGRTLVEWPCPQCGQNIKRRSSKIGKNKHCQSCNQRASWDKGRGKLRRTRAHRNCTKCQKYLGYFTDSMVNQRTQPLRCRSCAMKAAWQDPTKHMIKKVNRKRPDSIDELIDDSEIGRTQ